MHRPSSSWCGGCGTGLNSVVSSFFREKGAVGKKKVSKFMKGPFWSGAPGG